MTTLPPVVVGLREKAEAAYHDYGVADIAVGGGERATVSVCAFIEAASPWVVMSLLDDNARLRGVEADLDRLRHGDLADFTDEDAGRALKLFVGAVREYANGEWPEDADRMAGLVTMCVLQGVKAAVESNATELTYGVTGATIKGESVGDWKITIARQALSHHPEGTGS